MSAGNRSPSLREDYRFMLNYFYMKNSLKKLWVLPILVVMLMTACSPPENTSSSNSNAAQASNSNASPPVAMSEPAPVTANANASIVTAPVQTSAPTDKTATIKPSIQPVPAAAPTDKAPKLVAPTAPLEFGKQPMDKTIVKSFPIRNTGNAALNIENVQPGCSCTTVDFPKVLQPGKAGIIKVKVDTGKAAGPHVKSVTIKSNDPVSPSLVVQFTFDVKG